MKTSNENIIYRLFEAVINNKKSENISLEKFKRLKLSPSQIDIIKQIHSNPNQDTLNALGVKSVKTQRNTNILSKLIPYLQKEKRLNIIDNKINNGISIGAGKGIEAKQFNLKTHEPFPINWNPDYTSLDGSDIPSNAFDFAVNTYVLNVVGKDTRDTIVKTIGRVLKPNGFAIIVTRGTDVIKPKGVYVQIGPMEIITRSEGELTYQKGFTLTELINYVQSVLGPSFTVEPQNGTKPDSVKIRIHKN